MAYKSWLFIFVLFFVIPQFILNSFFKCSLLLVSSYTSQHIQNGDKKEVSGQLLFVPGRMAGAMYTLSPLTFTKTASAYTCLGEGKAELQSPHPGHCDSHPDNPQHL